MSQQEQLFPSETKTKTVVPREASIEPVPRAPGWVLIGTIKGPMGFHRVRSMNRLGSLVTACGLVGRKIAEGQQAILECPECNAEAGETA